MATTETAVPSEQNTENIGSNIWPLAGLFVALLVNAAWIALLGYCIVNLVI